MAANLVIFLIGIVLGLLSGVIIERIRYSHQRRLLERQSLLSPLIKIFGIISRMEQLIFFYRKFFKIHYSYYKNQIKSSKFPLLDLIRRSHIERTKLLIQECKNFEGVFSGLEQSGQLQIIKVRDKKLHLFINRVHEQSEYLMSKKVETGEDALKLQIPMHNLQSNLKFCEKRLGKFLK